MALDGDKAAQIATARLTEGLRPLAIAGQLDLLVVALPPGDAPDSLVRRKGAQGAATPPGARTALADLGVGPAPGESAS
jgi:DNA primase